MPRLARFLGQGHSQTSLRSLRQMADRSFEWARARNLVRTNEVHGEEEASLVLEDSFAVAEQTGWEGSQSGAMELSASLAANISHT